MKISLNPVKQVLYQHEHQLQGPKMIYGMTAFTSIIFGPDTHLWRSVKNAGYVAPKTGVTCIVIVSPLQDHTLTSDELSAMYPRWTQFEMVRQRLDPDGMFTNANLERVLGPGIGSKWRWQIKRYMTLLLWFAVVCNQIISCYFHF